MRTVCTKNKMTDISHEGCIDTSKLNVGIAFAADNQGPYRIQSLTDISKIFCLIAYKFVECRCRPRTAFVFLNTCTRLD